MEDALKPDFTAGKATRSAVNPPIIRTMAVEGSIDPLFQQFFKGIESMYWYMPLNPYQQFSKPFTGWPFKLRRVLYYFVLTSQLLLITLYAISLAHSIMEKEFLLCLTVTVWFVLAINAYQAMWFTWNIGPQLIELIRLLYEDFPRTESEKTRIGAEKLANDWSGTMGVQVKVYLAATFNMSAMPFVYSAIGYYSQGEWNSYLPLLLWFPFDPTSMPLYPFIYLLEMWFFAVNTFILVANFGLLGAITMLVCMQFKIVALNFRNLSFSGNHASDIKAVEMVIQQHNRVLFVARRTREIFSFSLLVTYTIASIVTCIFLFLIVNESHALMAIQYITNLICYLVYNCVFAYYGNEIIENSQAIGEAVYDSDWTTADVRTQKLLVLIIQRANSPEYLTGMGFFESSFPTMSKILTTSYSYFTLLKTTYNQD